jgi:GR25 family glycosyltransferase involved in LPS biosynthesis
MHDFSQVATFVIALEKEPRNTLLVDQLQAQGLRVHVVAAVDGRLWTPPFDPSIVDVKRFKIMTGRMPTGPEIGCALSHQVCIRQAKDLDAEYALIFEDDAILISELAPYVKIIEQLPLDKPNILQLYYEAGSIVNKKTLSNFEQLDSYMVGRFFTPPGGTVAYLMNRQAIEIFAIHEKVEGVADWPPFSDALDFWACFPTPIRHPVGNSMIEHSRSTNQTKEKKRLIQIVINYSNLFRLRRLILHSRILGSFRLYGLRVIGPSTLSLLRYFRTEHIGSKEEGFRAR